MYVSRAQLETAVFLQQYNLPWLYIGKLYKCVTYDPICDHTQCLNKHSCQQNISVRMGVSKLTVNVFLPGRLQDYDCILGKLVLQPPAEQSLVWKKKDKEMNTVETVCCYTVSFILHWIDTDRAVHICLLANTGRVSWGLKSGGRGVGGAGKREKKSEQGRVCVI